MGTCIAQNGNARCPEWEEVEDGGASRPEAPRSAWKTRCSSSASERMGAGRWKREALREVSLIQ